MKAAFIGVLTGLQSLGGDESRERPVDRLTALGAIQARSGERAERESKLCALGVRLLSFKYAHCPRSKAEAEELLTEILAWPMFVPEWEKMAWKREKVAVSAIREFITDVCSVCGGAMEIPDKSIRHTEGPRPMKPCPPRPDGCGGTGKHRHSDAERIEAMGESFAGPMYHAHLAISRAEYLALELGRKMVGRE